MSHPESVSEWTEIAADPDPERDLGYECRNWDVISVDQRGDEHVVFLPPDEDDVWKEEFIVTERGSLCDPVSMR